MIKGYIYVLSCLAIIASPDPFAVASDWQDILEPEFDIYCAGSSQGDCQARKRE